MKGVQECVERRRIKKDEANLPQRALRVLAQEIPSGRQKDLRTAIGGEAEDPRADGREGVSWIWA